MWMQKHKKGGADVQNSARNRSNNFILPFKSHLYATSK